MKRPFLVVYDYGTGGLWWYIWADSAPQIEDRFVDVRVLDALPPWWSMERGFPIETVDIDQPEMPPGLAGLARK